MDSSLRIKINNCGCNLIATKRISKTAVKSRTNIFPSTTAKVWCGKFLPFLIIVSILMIQFIQIGSAETTTAIKHHRKQKRDNLFAFHKLTEMPWINPCGGRPQDNIHSISNRISNIQSRRKNKLKFYIRLRKLIREHRRRIDPTINISDYSNIIIHYNTYKFLPQILSNSTMNLYRFYGYVQTYIASFDYLARELSTADNGQRFIVEVKALFFESKKLLCELTKVINATVPINKHKMMKAISRPTMEKRLKFNTKLRHPKSKDVDEIDLKFTKYRFRELLKQMEKIIRTTIVERRHQWHLPKPSRLVPTNIPTINTNRV